MTIDLETVVRLWKQAGGTELQDGLRDDGSSSVYYDIWPEQLEKFVQLVLEHGRKPLTEMDCLIALENTAVNDMRFSLSQRVAIVRAVEAAHGIHA